MATESRLRKLTEKGDGIFKERVQRFVDQLRGLDTEIDIVVAESVAVMNINDLQKHSHVINSKYKAYSDINVEFMAYLQRTCTEESQELITKQQNVADMVLNKVQHYRKILKEQTEVLTGEEHIESVSAVGSHNSRHGASSNISSLMMKQRVKAEAAKTRLRFAEREAELERQQTELLISKKLLASQKEADEAQAELDAMSNILKEELDIKSHTSPKLRQSPNHVEPQDSVKVDTTNVNAITMQSSTTPHLSRPLKGDLVTGSPLNPASQPYIPARYPADVCSELSRHLLKKDLLLSRFSKFNDRPEYFAVWRGSFTNIVQELNVSPNEEMDLLVKWLGLESSRQAASIRAANAHNPYQGLRKIWERLEDRYASPELVESELKRKLYAFPRLTNKDHSKLYDLADIVSEIVSVKDNPRYSALLAYYDSSSGVSPIVSKLPYSVQEKWTNEAVRYTEAYGVLYPPLHVFCDFLCRQAKIKNNPSFMYDASPVRADTKKATNTNFPQNKSNFNLTSKKTDVSQPTEKLSVRLCPYHEQSEGHTLNYCKGFRRLPIKDRKEFLKKQKICFRCCEGTDHMAGDCQETVLCFFCKTDKHATALHVNDQTVPKSAESKTPPKKYGGEGKDHTTGITATCTQVCDNPVVGKSCSRTVLVRVFPEGQPARSIITYAVLDDQSNRSLVKTELLDAFGENGHEIEYTLSSCNGVTTRSGRRASGYVVQSLDGSSTLHLPTLIECEIPNVREEIPTYEVAENHPHLQDIAEFIPPIDCNAGIFLLIGRDLPIAHHVLDQRLGPPKAPYAQRMHLGWVIVGDVCLGKIHQPDDVTVLKTNILMNGRSTIMPLCENNFEIKEVLSPPDIFVKTRLDEARGTSIEDRKFLELMDSEFLRDSDGFWTAPLPFRSERSPLPCNKQQAIHRAELLDKSLRKNPEKCQHMVTFMAKIIDKGHAEVAPTLGKGQECWYLPLFGVYHPKKPGCIRGVFDSSAKYNGVSLNDVLMTGPDLTNNLLGILLRFRTEAVAVTADVEQMFCCFKVIPSHRDYLRFLWYKDNDPNQPLIEYRMTAHVFGNAPSPAIATYDWDEVLPSKYLTEWQNWRDSLPVLENLKISRAYSECSFSLSEYKELHLFADASKEAVAVCAYLKIYDVNSPSASVTFVLGKAKVAPRHGHTIPRLELCAAVLAVEVADVLVHELKLDPDCLRFYTDSRVVLGYIYNEKRRFHVYVTNRVARIHKSSRPHQWHYVSSDVNPADEGTRSLSPQQLGDSLWLKGPEFLRDENPKIPSYDTFPLMDPEHDKELKLEVISLKTAVSTFPQELRTERFSKFSSWARLARAVSLLKHVARTLHHPTGLCKGWHKCNLYKTADCFREAEIVILRALQQEHYSEEIASLKSTDMSQFPPKSSILSLSPILDECGILRVGGRLKNCDLPISEIQPIIIPRKHHLAKLLVQHFHKKTCHQGRHLTEGAVRSGGYWIVGAKRLISSVINKCIICRKLRSKPETQKMSDLPPDRITSCPPFTYVGVDAFGPWEIVTRRTRGATSSKKRWAILFTCLVIRAVHIDIVEEMSSSSFINCLRRFVALRGDVKQFRSDRGTNFVGSTEPLNINSINVEDGSVHDFLYVNGVTWVFNAPHSSHMGGVWERMIGTARRILNAMLLNVKNLTHEVLSTLMAEVTAIINARPITVISTDPDVPTPLTPSMILTQKSCEPPNFNSSFDTKDMYKAQWRRVQALADTFWHRWRHEYLHTLQKRTKWETSKPNFREGDVVLLKDNRCVRHEWPMGRIQEVFPEPDGLVRKVSVRVCKGDKCGNFIRPITDLIRLL